MEPFEIAIFLFGASLLAIPIATIWLVFKVWELTANIKSLQRRMEDVETGQLTAPTPRQVLPPEPQRLAPEPLPAPVAPETPPEPEAPPEPETPQEVPVEPQPEPVLEEPVAEEPVAEEPVDEVVEAESPQAPLAAKPSKFNPRFEKPPGSQTPEAEAPAQPNPPREPQPEQRQRPVPPAKQPEAPQGPGLINILQENVLAVIGVLVIFVGLAALIRYGASEGWFSFPIEFRLAGIAAFGIAGTAIGWWQRNTRRAFGLSLQGGGVGVLLMTTFAAFRFYELLDPTLALGMAIILVTALGIMAVAQNASGLAVLAILAGFASPLLISTGSGNHVALFSYYAVLNFSIFGMSWWRSWKWLNLLGFFFTYGIGLLWGGLEYSDEKLMSTIPFVAVFYAFFLAIPIFNARKETDRSSLGFADMVVVFGNPLFAYLSVTLLILEQLPLAWIAFGVALLNMVLGAVLLRLQDYRGLGMAHAAIALTFATLAVPLAFSAQTTVAIFAIEGAILIWLGLKNNIGWQRLVGGLLKILAAIFYIFVNTDISDPAIFNPAFMSGLVLALAGFATALFHRRREDSTDSVLFVWGLFWWVVTGLREINEFVHFSDHYDAWLVFAALTMGSLASFHKYFASQLLRLAVVVGFACGALALPKIEEFGHVFSGWGPGAWAIWGTLAMCSLYSLRDHKGLTVPTIHAIWVLVVGVVVSSFANHTVGELGLATGWEAAAGVVPWLVLVGLTSFAPRVIFWPTLGFERWRPFLMAMLQAVVLVLWLILLTHPGDSGLTWIPLVNPVELVLLTILAMFIAWFKSGLVEEDLRGMMRTGISLVSLVSLTNVTLRAVHQYTDAPWSFELWDNATAQMSLTVVWSLFGMGHWIAGSKRGDRGMWKVGAILIGLVLVKLIVVDRTHLGDLMGIGSFIAFGLLCLVVGYLAPAPVAKDAVLKSSPDESQNAGDQP